jgi:hypothetical protein
LPWSEDLLFQMPPPLLANLATLLGSFYIYP